MRACGTPRDRTSNNGTALGTGFPMYRGFIPESWKPYRSLQGGAVRHGIPLVGLDSSAFDRLWSRKESAEGFHLRRGTRMATRELRVFGRPP